MDVLVGHLILHKFEDLSSQLITWPYGSIWWLRQTPLPVGELPVLMGTDASIVEFVGSFHGCN